MRWFVDTCLYPYKYAFCPDEKTWNRVVPRIIKKPHPYPSDKHGCCTYFHYFDGQHVSIVTVNHDKGRTRNQLVGLIAHEAYHVVCNLITLQGDEKPSEEYVACAIQRVTMDLLSEYDDHRGRK